MSSRIVSPLLSLAVGIGSGVYIFKPLLQSYGESTGGSFRPEDDHHSAPVPNLPWTNLQPGKTPEGTDLLVPPAQDPAAPVEREQELQRKV